jgi:AhpD family alkylhydroperoxidase
MKDVHEIFTSFKNDFPTIYAKYEEFGQELHLNGGPLPEKMRWLIKLAISGATGHHRALETHRAKAAAAGASDEEILHALLLLIPTCGFPTFMEAYKTFKDQN